MHQVNNTTS